MRAGVLVPARDCAPRIGAVIAGCVASGLPVYLVDDGSRDDTGSRGREAGAIVIRQEKNLGKGRALLAGMKAMCEAGHSHAICLDGDGQHEPGDIPAFHAALLREPAAIVAGVRDLSGAPLRSRLGRRFSNFWIRAECGAAIGDAHCGFRAYPIGTVLGLKLSGRRYEMEVELLTRALWSGVPVRDLPCRVYYPADDESLGAFRPIVDSGHILAMSGRLLGERILRGRRHG